MSRNKKHRILAVLLIALVVVTVMIFSILPDNPAHTLASPFSVVLRPIERLYRGLNSVVTKYVTTTKSNRELSQENERLRKENLSLRMEIKENEQAALAYSDLKQAFSLKDLYPDSQFLAANILQRPLDQDYAYMRIDQGKAGGITMDRHPGYAVVDENASLVGTVINSDLLSAKVLPIYHDGFSASVFAEGEMSKDFVLNGQILKTGEKTLIASEIPEDANIAVGSKIYTSGKGELLPENILCGEVLELYPQDASGYRRALVEPAGDIDELHVVFVLIPQNVWDRPADMLEENLEMNGEKESTDEN